MATYLVTGVAGFIASKVASLLLADGHRIIGVDNLNDAYDVQLKQWRLAQISSHPNFRFARIDIGDISALRSVFTGVYDQKRSTVDAVINLAARAGVRQSVENPALYIETNTTGTLNLLRLCRDFSIGKFILASTSGLYGNSEQMPYNEELDTSTPLSPYAASKKAAEALCYTYHYLYGIDITVLRYFTVFGPAGRPDMSLFRFVQWISEGRPVMVFGDGRQSRDFTYVDDIARGTVGALKPLGYEIINLGSDTPIVLLDAIRVVERLTGKQALLTYSPAHRADVRSTWANIGKAQTLLGWCPRARFEDGVAALVDWYQSNRSWAKGIATG